MSGTWVKGTPAGNCWSLYYIRVIYFSIKVKNSFASVPLDPFWVTAFVDGEGSFHVSVIKNKDSKHGWRVQQEFSIELHIRDVNILILIKKELTVGKIYKIVTSVVLRVYSIKELEIIIAFFEKYTLITKKRVDYVLFKQAIDIVQKKEHLTIEGLQKIIAIKASINWGLSDVLKKAFPDVVPVVRPIVENSFPKIIDPNWLAGFTDAEGCFLINIYKS